MSAYAVHAPKDDKSPQEIYIEKYSSLAVEEMYRSGIPAPAYGRFIQIPLHEGEAVRSAADWIEE